MCNTMPINPAVVTASRKRSGKILWLITIELEIVVVTSLVRFVKVWELLGGIGPGINSCNLFKIFGRFHSLFPVFALID